MSCTAALMAREQFCCVTSTARAGTRTAPCVPLSADRSAGASTASAGWVMHFVFPHFVHFLIKTNKIIHNFPVVLFPAE